MKLFMECYILLAMYICNVVTIKQDI